MKELVMVKVPLKALLVTQIVITIVTHLPSQFVDCSFGLIVLDCLNRPFSLSKNNKSRQQNDLASQ